MATFEIDETPNSDGEDSETTVQRQKRQRSLMICGHCDRALTKSTYYRHKRSYFNPVSGTWLRTDAPITQERASVSPLPPVSASVADGSGHPTGIIKQIFVSSSL